MRWQGDSMKIEFDVLIAGTGSAGLYSAINLRKDLRVLLITKGFLKESNSYLAQGGISTARGLKDVSLFVEDTLKAGQYKNDVSSVKILAEESMRNIRSILDIGVSLDTDSNELCYTREGAHSINRIVHSKDRTGAALIDALCKEAEKRSNITILEDCYLADIITNGNSCAGAVLFKNDEKIKVYSKVTILAMGGIGGIFKNSTNRRNITADGITIALKNNIKLKDMEYIQFHPTALYEKDSKERKFLISESVRGEGGILRNSNGNRFVDELLPRDVVTKAIFKEIKASGIPYVNLDISFMKKDYIINRFPTIYKECLKRGIDITVDLIPVFPAQHYFMGGIQVDKYCETSMENLFAVGEVSCTGVHGANRLASNSLLEGLVFSKRAAEKINATIHNITAEEICVPNIEGELEDIKKENIRIAVEEFKRRMTGLNDELVSY